MSGYIELNCDGLVGPTHFYGGLASGNKASNKHKNNVSNPKEAALQGLEKMKLVYDLTGYQLVIPPQPRPIISAINRFSENGNGIDIAHFYQQYPDYAAACFSASSMWVANIATMTPSCDAGDGQAHITPANLVSQFHRSLELIYSKEILTAIFPSSIMHPANLISIPDEGAANIMRLSDTQNENGIYIYVYGKSVFDHKSPTHIYPARQSKEAFDFIKTSHQLQDNDVVYLQQNPEVIDQGVFHNDVIAMSHQNIVIFHEKAFRFSDEGIDEIKEKFKKKTNQELIILQIHDSDILVGEAVSSYLFNSQIVSNSNGEYTLIAPIECQAHLQAKMVIEKIIMKKTPITKVVYQDVSQSMNNGGGPACLRWRFIINTNELNAVNTSCMMTEDLYYYLKDWITQHYLDSCDFQQLFEVKYIENNKLALTELYQKLNISIV